MSRLHLTPVAARAEVIPGPQKDLQVRAVIYDTEAHCDFPSKLGESAIEAFCEDYAGKPVLDRRHEIDLVAPGEVIGRVDSCERRGTQVVADMTIWGESAKDEMRRGITQGFSVSWGTTADTNITCSIDGLSLTDPKSECRHVPGWDPDCTALYEGGVRPLEVTRTYAPAVDGTAVESVVGLRTNADELERIQGACIRRLQGDVAMKGKALAFQQIDEEEEEVEGEAEPEAGEPAEVSDDDATEDEGSDESGSDESGSSDEPSSDEPEEDDEDETVAARLTQLSSALKAAQSALERLSADRDAHRAEMRRANDRASQLEATIEHERAERDMLSARSKLHADPDRIIELRKRVGPEVWSQFMSMIPDNPSLKAERVLSGVGASSTRSSRGDDPGVQLLYASLDLAKKKGLSYEQAHQQLWPSFAAKVRARNSRE
jgi:hypothetical protein